MPAGFAPFAYGNAQQQAAVLYGPLMGTLGTTRGSGAGFWPLSPTRPPLGAR